MIRLSRLADYGIVIMTRFARTPGQLLTAPEVAAHTRIPQPMVSKILKTLARERILRSHRGAKGGYSLGLDPHGLSVADVIGALEGPIALTACVEHGSGDCEIEQFCPARANWRHLNDAVRAALDQVSLADMARPSPAFVLRPPSAEPAAALI